MSTWAQIASKIEPDVFNKESKIKSKEIKSKEIKSKEINTKEINTKEIETEIDMKKKYNDELAMFLKKYYEEN